MERWLQGQVRGTGINLQTSYYSLDLSSNASAAALLEQHSGPAR